MSDSNREVITEMHNIAVQGIEDSKALIKENVELLKGKEALEARVKEFEEREKLFEQYFNDPYLPAKYKALLVEACDVGFKLLRENGQNAANHIKYRKQLNKLLEGIKDE